MLHAHFVIEVTICVEFSSLLLCSWMTYCRLHNRSHTCSLQSLMGTFYDYMTCAVSFQSGSSVAEASSSASSSQQLASGRAPLGEVVVDAVKRWYMDAHRDALKGDVVSVGIMINHHPGAHIVNTFCRACSALISPKADAWYMMTVDD